MPTVFDKFMTSASCIVSNKLKQEVFARLSQAKKNNIPITIEIPELKQKTNLIKNYNSPLDAVSNFSEYLARYSGLAKLNSKLISMNEPLEESGVLELLKFKDSRHDPTFINQSFWKSCSFLLAATVHSSFKEDYNIKISSIPDVPLEEGHFYIDFTTSQKLPTLQLNHLRSLSNVAMHIAKLKLPFLSIKLNYVEAEKMSLDPGMFQMIGDRFSYALETSSVPLISNTSLINQFEVTKITNLSSDNIYRIYGVALPSAFATHHTTFNKIVQASRI